VRKFAKAKQFYVGCRGDLMLPLVAVERFQNKEPEI
jgi:hypothetical protein